MYLFETPKSDKKMPKKVKLAPIDDSGVRLESANRSIMSGYSKALEEQQKVQNKNSSIADKIFAPKMKYVNNILGQHLIHHNFYGSFDTFMQEMDGSVLNPDIRGIKTNAHLLKAEMFHVSPRSLLPSRFHNFNYQIFLNKI